MGDYMISWHSALKLHEETLFLAFYIMDKYMFERNVESNEVNLLVLTSIFIASKFEEIYFINTLTFERNCHSNKVSKALILNLEQKILEALNFQLIFICPRDILKRLIFILKLEQSVGN